MLLYTQRVEAKLFVRKNSSPSSIAPKTPCQYARRGCRSGVRITGFPPMKRLHRSVAHMAVSLATLSALGSAAVAGGFAVREQSAQAQGMSFAGAASGSGG